MIFFGKMNKKKRLIAAFLFVLVSLILQIIGSLKVGSIAIKIDTWHTASHLISYVIAWLAIVISTHNKNNSKYVFGTGKVEVLSGFSSAIVLAISAIELIVHCFDQLLNPSSVQYGKAIAVATVGLINNLASAVILNHSDPSDHNFRAAFLHALADILTSVLAIVGLTIQKFSGIAGIDPAIGLIGCLFVGKWSIDLIASTSGILLDLSAKEQKEIVRALEAEAGTKVVSAKIWRVSPKKLAANITLEVDRYLPPNYYEYMLKVNYRQISYLSLKIKPLSSPGVKTAWILNGCEEAR